MYAGVFQKRKEYMLCCLGKPLLSWHMCQGCVFIAATMKKLSLTKRLGLDGFQASYKSLHSIVALAKKFSYSWRLSPLQWCWTLPWNSIRPSASSTSCWRQF